ncbi:hypothetical protein TNCT_642421 [Trichonephila clavata]|uniref:Uncharacterized protein n=1 Tax=Trichonephila clavata TaxID=2740835 RepID=A0A8X6I0J4_TRICU|nr:hypothetical protein TNCT_642421 [Trichonephila clavata]
MLFGRQSEGLKNFLLNTASILLVLAHVVRLSSELFRASSREQILLPVAQVATSSAKKKKDTPSIFWMAIFKSSIIMLKRRQLRTAICGKSCVSQLFPGRGDIENPASDVAL